MSLVKQLPIICLMGPTASGKTQLAVELTQLFPCEIISVDSAMVYRMMNIGTAKPSPEILKIAPHRLINIRDPQEVYSAAQFREDALREIANILQQNKIPLLVGGTMLYFKVLQQGLSELPAADARLRTELYTAGVTQGWPALHARLAAIDGVAAVRIHPHDSQRIQRALEVYELTGKTITEWQQQTKLSFTTNPIHNLAVTPLDRSLLHQRIAERFSYMLEAGLLEEVRQLFVRGDLTLETPAIRSVGYRQVWEYLQGKYNWQTMRDNSIAATRQLAKRQLTWLRSWPQLTWLNSEENNLLEHVSNYLKPFIS